MRRISSWGSCQRARARRTSSFGSVGALAALFTGKKLVSGIESAFSTGETVLKGIGKVSQVLNIPGLSKLANIGGSTGLDAAAANLDSAAASLKAAAGSLDTSAEGLDTAATKEDVGGTPGGSSKVGSAVGAALMAAIGAYIIGHVADLFIGPPTKKDDQTYNQQVPGWLKKPADFVFGSKAPAVYRDVPSSLGPVTPVLKGSTYENLWHALFGGGPTPKPMANDNYALGFGPNAPKPMANDNYALGFGRRPQADGERQLRPGFGPNSAPSGPLPASGRMDTIGVGGHASVLAAPDLSALTAAKAKAESAAKGVTTAVETALHKPVKAIAPDLSAYVAAKGPARADGANMSAGFAQGIESGKGAAVAAAADVASAAAAAMGHALDSHSPSKVTEKIGADAAAGFVVGLQGGTAAINAAATAMGKNVAKAADITTLDSTVTKLLGYVPSGDSGMVKMLKADQGKLTALMNRRQVLETEITDAQQIAQQAISSANITGAGTYTPVLAASSGPLAASATISGMQSMAADQAQFAKVIGQLKKEGLNATSLNQFTQAGVSSLPQALGLEQGGKSAVNSVNKLEGKIRSSAAQLGAEGAGPMYQAGVQAAQGLAAGLIAEMGAVDASIKKLAGSMVATIKDSLKSKSPSLVFRDVGLSIPQGVAMGVDAGTPVAQAAVGRMGSRLGGGHPGVSYGHDGASAGGHGGRSGGVTIHNVTNVTVQGSVTTENDLLSKIQAAQLKKANSNWQGGWRLPGRAPDGSLRRERAVSGGQP